MPANPVLVLDSLKVSTMEQTAEEVEARGGKGNAILISWDINKEINFTLEDALFSAKSMAIMFGNGHVKELGGDKLIMKSEVFTCTTNATSSLLPKEGATACGWSARYEAPDGKTYLKKNPKFFEADGTEIEGSSLKANTKYFCSFDLEVAGSVIDISANSFPGTYYCVGDTVVRSAADGNDEFFQLIVPKAKVTSENTITMEADGDPSTFNMNLKVLKPDDGSAMVRLVKYSLAGTADSSAEATAAELVHNHQLNPITNGGKAST